MHAAILVAYASRNGATAEVAEVIAQELGCACGVIDVAPVQRIRDIRRYRAILLGTAIRDQRWLPESIAFLAAERAILRLRLVACFSTCGLLRWDTDVNRMAAAQPFQAVHRLFPEIRPLEVGLFAGRVPDGNGRPPQRILSEGTVLEPGDWRNWEAIRGWARSVAALLPETQITPAISKVKACILS